MSTDPSRAHSWLQIVQRRSGARTTLTEESDGIALANRCSGCTHANYQRALGNPSFSQRTALDLPRKANTRCRQRNFDSNHGFWNVFLPVKRAVSVVQVHEKLQPVSPPRLGLKAGPENIQHPEVQQVPGWPTDEEDRSKVIESIDNATCRGGARKVRTKLEFKMLWQTEKIIQNFKNKCNSVRRNSKY